MENMSKAFSKTKSLKNKETDLINIVINHPILVKLCPILFASSILYFGIFFVLLPLHINNIIFSPYSVLLGFIFLCLSSMILHKKYVV